MWSKKARQTSELSWKGEKMVLELLLGNGDVLELEEVVRPCEYDLDSISTHRSLSRSDVAKT